MKTDFKDTETSWLPQFYTNGANGTKFSPCFFIGMGFRNRFARNLQGKNGYFIGFWDFRPNFDLVLHTSKWLLCHQKALKLFTRVPRNRWHPNFIKMSMKTAPVTLSEGICAEKYYQTRAMSPWHLITPVTFTEEICAENFYQNRPMSPWVGEKNGVT